MIPIGQLKIYMVRRGQCFQRGASKNSPVRFASCAYNVDKTTKCGFNIISSHLQNYLSTSGITLLFTDQSLCVRHKDVIICACIQRQNHHQGLWMPCNPARTVNIFKAGEKSILTWLDSWWRPIWRLEVLIHSLQKQIFVLFKNWT